MTTELSPQHTPRTAKRYRIGLLVDSLHESYQVRIWTGAVEQARLEDVNLICIAGGALRAPQKSSANRVVLHELIGPHSLDGLIATSGSIGNFVPAEELHRYYARFAGLPLISIGGNFNDIPGVVADNRGGMYALVSHFIAEHGCRRIAFINGPLGVHDGRERFDAYREALSDHGIPYDERRVVQGDFQPHSGADAVLQLVNERRVEFDAVIAANDYMAIDAMRVLRQLGFNMPDEVKVGGFDDIRETRDSTPALTTVRQPSRALGGEAVRRMAAWLRGVAPPLSVTVPAHIMIRGSCGCRGAAMQRHRTPAILEADTAPAVAMGNVVRALASELEQRFPLVSVALRHQPWGQMLVEAFLAEQTGEEPAFIRMLEQLVRTAEDGGVEASVWAEILNDMFGRMRARPYFPDPAEIRKLALAYLAQHLDTRHTNRREQLYERHIQYLFWFEQSLSMTFSRELLADVVRETMPRLGINALHVSLYTDARAAARGSMRPMLAFEYHSPERFTCRVYAPDEAPPFPAQTLIPQGLHNDAEPYSINVLPLFFDDEQLGIAVFDNTHASALISEFVANQLASFIRGARLVEERQGHTRRLEHQIDAATAELRRLRKALQDKDRELTRFAHEQKPLHEH